MRILALLTLLSIGFMTAHAQPIFPPDPISALPKKNSEATRPNVHYRIGWTVTITNGQTIVRKFTNVGTSPRTITVDLEDLRRRWLVAIEEERKLGINNDIRERWDKLNKRADSLETAMSVKQVVELLGKPTRVEVLVPQDPQLFVWKQVDLETMINQPRSCLLRYSPYENDPDGGPKLGRDRKPYDRLWLDFDDQGWLLKWRWE